MTEHLKNAGFNNDGTIASLATAAGDDAGLMIKLCALTVLYMDHINGAYPDQDNIIRGCFMPGVTKELYKVLPLEDYAVHATGVAHDVSDSNESGDSENDLEYFEDWPEEVFMAITGQTPVQYFKKAKKAKKAKGNKRGEAKGNKARADEKQERGEGDVPASPVRPSGEAVGEMKRKASEAKKRPRKSKAPTMPDKAELEGLGAALGLPVRGQGSPPSKKPRLEKSQGDGSGDDDKACTLSKVRDLMGQARAIQADMAEWTSQSNDDAMTKVVAANAGNETVLELAAEYDRLRDVATDLKDSILPGLAQNIEEWIAAIDEMLAVGKGEGNAVARQMREEEVKKTEKSLRDCEAKFAAAILQMATMVTLAEKEVGGDDDDTGASGGVTPSFEAGARPRSPSLGETSEMQAGVPPPPPGKFRGRRPRAIGPMGPTAARSLSMELELTPLVEVTPLGVELDPLYLQLAWGECQGTL